MHFSYFFDIINYKDKKGSFKMINQLEKNRIYEYFLERVSEIYKVAPNIFSQKDGNDFDKYHRTL